MSDPRLTLLKQAKKYTLTNQYNLYHMPEPKYLIPGFLPQGAVMGVTSPPGLGKTWLMMELIRSSIMKDKFLGKFEWSDATEYTPNVLFVGSDASPHDYARQFRRLMWDQYLIDKQTPLESYPSTYETEYEGDNGETVVISEPMTEFGWDYFIGQHERPYDLAHFLLQSDFMLDEVSKVNNLIVTANSIHRYHNKYEWMPLKWGVDVIIFDTLSRLTHANQNDNSEMEEVFRNIRFISEQTGATCILLHHNAKRSEHNSGEDWRGAVSQIGALDCWLQLKTSVKGDKYTIEGEWKKFRGLTPENIHYFMDVNKDGKAIIKALPPERISEDTGRPTGILHSLVYDYIAKSDKPVTIDDIHEALWPTTTDQAQGDKKKHRAKVRNLCLKIPEHPVEHGDVFIMKLPKQTNDRNEPGLWHRAEER